MKNFVTLLILFLLAVVISACTPDGEVDGEAIKGYFEKAIAEMPTKEDFKAQAEERIAKLPADEQAEARQELQKALDEWPTEEEVAKMKAEYDKAIDEFAAEAPNAEEARAMIKEAAEQLPSKEELHRAVDQLPDNDEMKNLIDQGLNSFFSQMDSLATEMEKQ